MISEMVESMSKDNNSIRTSTAENLYDTITQSITRVVDEVAKAQPQYSQSISNLQLDYIQAVRNMVQNTLAAQKNIADARGFSFNLPFASHYLDQIRNQTNEIANNVVNTVQVNNQVAVNSLDAARDNIRLYTRTTDTILELNSNIAKAWTTFFFLPQQQFFSH